MSPVKLAVEHLVAATLQLRDDPAAAAVYRQYPIARAVGDEDARRAGLPGRRHEPRRESDHVPEEVTIGEPQREGVGGPVRETPYGHVLRGDGIAGERLSQRAVYQGQVGAEAAADEEVPSVPARSRGEQQQPGHV